MYIPGRYECIYEGLNSVRVSKIRHCRFNLILNSTGRCRRWLSGVNESAQEGSFSTDLSQS